MSCVEGDLRKVIFNGKNEYVFKIPNYCICDPVFDDAYYLEDLLCQEQKHRELSLVSSCPTLWPSGWRSTTSPLRWALICKRAASRP